MEVRREQGGKFGPPQTPFIHEKSDMHTDIMLAKFIRKFIEFTQSSES